MPRDINGNYSLPNGTIVATGDTILPSQHNPAMNDIAQGITLSLARNGNGPMLANLDMGGFNLGNAAAITAVAIGSSAGMTAGTNLVVNGMASIGTTLTSGGKITSNGGLQVNGGTIYEGPYAVWHAGNLNPSLYQLALGYTAANAAGQNFTGPVTATSIGSSGGLTAGTNLQVNGNSNVVGTGAFGGAVTAASVSATGNVTGLAIGSSAGMTAGGAFVGNSTGSFTGALTAASVSATGSVTAATIGSSAGMTSGGAFVGNSTGAFAGALSAASVTAPTHAVDAGLFLDLAGGDANQPRLNFAAGDGIIFDRAANKLLFYIGNVPVGSLDASGNLRVLGNITASAGTV